MKAVSPTTVQVSPVPIQIPQNPMAGIMDRGPGKRIRPDISAMPEIRENFASPEPFRIPRQT